MSLSVAKVAKVAWEQLESESESVSASGSESTSVVREANRCKSEDELNKGEFADSSVCRRRRCPGLSRRRERRNEDDDDDGDDEDGSSKEAVVVVVVVGRGRGRVGRIRGSWSRWQDKVAVAVSTGKGGKRKRAEEGSKRS